MDLKPGSVLRETINHEFMSEKYKEFRQVYFKSYNKKELSFIKECYYKDLNDTQEFMWFVPWFSKWKPQQYELLVLTTQQWKIHGDNKTTWKSTHPPPLHIDFSANNK